MALHDASFLVKTTVKIKFNYALNILIFSSIIIMPLVNDSIISTDRTVVADILDERILLASVTGPLTPDVVMKAVSTIAPLGVRLDATGLKWGTVLHIERDATFFPESIELFFDLTTQPLYKNRTRFAIVVCPEVPFSGETAHKLKELYAHKAKFDVQVFPHGASAVKWVNELHYEGDM